MAAASVSGGWLAVVPGNACAGHRLGPGGRPGDGGSVHVYSFHRPLRHGGLGREGLAGGAGISRTAAGIGAAAALAGCAAATTVQLGYWRNSETLSRHAIEVTSNNMMAEFLLGDALIKERKTEEGLEHLENVVRLFPGYAPAQSKIADVLAIRGRNREAIEHYRAALASHPDTPLVMNNLAWILATSADPDLRDSAEAVRLAEGACNLTRHRVALFAGTLAAAYADAGRYDDAVKTAQEAIATATAAGEAGLAGKTRQLMELYRAGKPYRGGGGGGSNSQ